MKSLFLGNRARDQVVVDALVEPVIRGHEVNKALLDATNPDFYDEIREATKQKKKGNFKAFLEDFNKEIDNDRKKGENLGFYVFIKAF